MTSSIAIHYFHDPPLNGVDVFTHERIVILCQDDVSKIVCELSLQVGLEFFGRFFVQGSTIEVDTIGVIGVVSGLDGDLQLLESFRPNIQRMWSFILEQFLQQFHVAVEISQGCSVVVEAVEKVRFELREDAFL